MTYAKHWDIYNRPDLVHEDTENIFTVGVQA